MSLSNLPEALKLENLRWNQVTTRLNEEEQDRIQKLTAEANYTGNSQSTWMVQSLIDIRSAKIKQLVDNRLDVRRNLLINFPELGKQDLIDDLLLEMNKLIASCLLGVASSRSGLASFTNNAFALEKEKERDLTRYADQAVEILRTEIVLGLAKKVESGTGLFINTKGGSVVVNQGPIYGDVQQIIGNVSQAGATELAHHLETLASAINADDSLGDDRAPLLEQLKFVGEQALAPRDSRQTSVVRGVLEGLRARLQDVAAIAQIISVAGPAVALHFGFQWPH